MGVEDGTAISRKAQKARAAIAKALQRWILARAKNLRALIQWVRDGKKMILKQYFPFARMEL